MPPSSTTFTKVLALISLLTLTAALPLTLSSAATQPPSTTIFLFLLLTLFLTFSAKLFFPLSTLQSLRTDRLLLLLLTSLPIFYFQTRLQHAAATGQITLLTFSQYFLAGGICAFLTHAACTPIDVVKTRLQTTTNRYTGLVDAFRKIIAEEGPATLLKGLGATASGYFLHGAFKYSFYELFKILLVGDPVLAIKPPLPVAALAGFFAECIACLLLCPMEAIRIRSVADSSFPPSVVSGLSLLYKSEGWYGWYKGLPAMLLKQVPYTVGQFVSFELVVNLVKRVVMFALHVEGPSAMGPIATVSGLLAGIAAAVISHPGDTILSKINQEDSDAPAFVQIARVARTAGFLGLFLGLGARVLQVSCMIGGQFLIYDSIKLWCGLKPASALPVNVVAAGVAVAAAVDAVQKLR